MAVPSLSERDERDDDAGCDRGVVRKVARILDCFAEPHEPLGLSELARRAGLNKATVHRLARELVDEGLLEASAAGYQLGAKLFELGHAVRGHRALREAALPYLADLFVLSGETVHLAVREGTEVMYVERLVGHRSSATPSRVAGRMPLHCTATGKVLLTYAPAALVAQVLDGELERCTPYTIVVPRLLVEQMTAVRERGVAFERDETRLGYSSVAAPVFSRPGVCICAVSMTVPVARGGCERFAGPVRSSTNALSRALQASI